MLAILAGPSLPALAAAPTRATAPTPSAYATNFNSDTVSVVDTATNTVTATIPVGGGPTGVAITPQGTRAYVTKAFSNDVSVIDTTTNTVTATIPVGLFPIGVAITPCPASNSHTTNKRPATDSAHERNSDTSTIKHGERCEKQHHHNGRHDKKQKPGKHDARHGVPSRQQPHHG
ncbi:YncE family protein [Streptomyces sp. NPDC047022]|uniref:YncE family protein n=1 Tax=Streptomyces sp. NPDC047022 TaxID=3155737 RepID=UPI0033C5CD67